jgi:predicted nucleotidyltransferase component of viral defense system
MLQLSEIQKHYSSRENGLPRLVLKEYLQYKILEIIFSSKYADKLVFMGGTSVRIVLGNDRFSEDLDIDNSGISQTDFSDLMKIVKNKLEKEGLKVETRNTFKNVYHCYIKFPALLFDSRLSPLKDEKVMIQIDSFSNKENLSVDTRIISRADIFTEIRTYPPDLVLAQKIGALLNRKRAKGRDFYDTVFLFSMSEPDWTYLERHYQIKNFKEFSIAVKKRYASADIASLAKDVEPFLLNPGKIIQVEKFLKWLDDFGENKRAY